MEAAVVESGKTLAIKEIPVPFLPQGGAIIRVTGCGLCGSDMDKLFYRNTPEGTVLGHEVIGIIEELSPSAVGVGLKPTPTLGLYRGQRVSVAHHVPCRNCHYCLNGSPSMCRDFKKSNIVPGGFSQMIAVSKDHLAHTVFPLPDDISDEEAVSIEPLACCIRAIDRLPQWVNNANQTVFIVGLGFIGLLTAQYLRYQGYKTYGIDFRPERVSFAQKHDILDYSSFDENEITELLFSKTDGRGADILFLSILNPQAVDLALRAVRDGGTVILFSSYSKNKPILNQNELYFRELTVLTSYSPSLEHLKKSWDLITRKQINVAPLVTHRYPLADLYRAVESYRTGQAIKVLITV